MTPILFVTPGSCGLGSIVALEWLGRPYRISRLSVEEHSDVRYLALSPLGEVPALLSSGRILTESFAILHHLGTQDAAGRLIPKDAASFDRLNQSLAYLVSTFHAGFRPIFHPDRFAITEAGRKEAYDAAVGRLPKEYAHVERLLEDTGWFAGPGPSVVDAYFLGLARWGDKFIDVRSYPNIRRLRERLSEDPAVAFALDVEQGNSNTSSGSFQGLIGLADVARLPSR